MRWALYHRSLNQMAQRGSCRCDQNGERPGMKCQGLQPCECHNDLFWMFWWLRSGSQLQVTAIATCPRFKQWLFLGVRATTAQLHGFFGARHTLILALMARNVVEASEVVWHRYTRAKKLIWVLILVRTKANYNTIYVTIHITQKCKRLTHDFSRDWFMIFSCFIQLTIFSISDSWRFFFCLWPLVRGSWMHRSSARDEWNHMPPPNDG